LALADAVDDQFWYFGVLHRMADEQAYKQMVELKITEG
jgi:hypothetical protein